MQLYDPHSSRLFADTCHTDDLVWHLQLVAGAAALVGIMASMWNVSVGAVYGAAGILIGLGAGYVDRMNTGCGVFIYWEGPHKGVNSQGYCYKG